MAKRGTPIERLQTWVPKGLERYIDGLRYFQPADVARIISFVDRPFPNRVVTVSVDDGQRPTNRTIERSEALRQKLNEAAQWYEISANEQERPDAQDIRDALGNIGKQAEALLRALGVLSPLPKSRALRDARLRLETSSAPLSVEYERMENSVRGSLQNHATLWADEHGNLGALEILHTGRRGDRIADQIAAKSAVRTAVASVVLLRDWARMAQHRLGFRVERGRRRGRPEDEALNDFFGNLKGIWMDIWECSPSASRPKLSRRNVGEARGSPFFRFCRAVSNHLNLKLTNDAITDRLRLATARRRKRRAGKMEGPAA